MQCEAALPGFTRVPLPKKEKCIMIGSRKMAQLHTPAEAAEILRIRESWLRAKAAARAIPCTFIGKHLRFSDDDIAQIMAEGARQPVTRGRGTRR
jgi:excisionase family DNA binding protein